MRRLVLASVALAGIAALPLADDGPSEGQALLRQTLERTQDLPRTGWAYTETAVRNGRETVSRYDPRRPVAERWSLVSVDGHAPMPRSTRTSRPPWRS